MGMFQGESSLLRLLSPAKLNLFFRVLSKREDGYHEIASLYQAVDLFDTISLQFSSRDLFLSSDPSISLSDNTIVRALQLFRQKTNLSFFAKIILEKKIPIGGGLGGGSSNAATTLWGLNELCGRPLQETELLSLAAEIGSDVAFFFSLGTAYCTGRGEKIERVELPHPFSATLVAPSFGVMTPQVYKAVNLSLLSKEEPRNLLKSFWAETPRYYNDLERAAFLVEPRLKEVKEKLLTMGFDLVVMTGSGSSFFCLGEGRPKKEKGLRFTPIMNCQRKEREWYSSR